jgi:hypothetical protein
MHEKTVVNACLSTLEICFIPVDTVTRKNETLTLLLLRLSPEGRL